MVVERYTVNVRPGLLQELAALARREADRYPAVAIRVSTPVFGPLDTMAIEWEFENVAAREAYWDGWYAQPETPAFMEKWNELDAGGGTDELWAVEE
jgi:hypothetical protein